jgi:hypothetical protein
VTVRAIGVDDLAVVGLVIPSMTSIAAWKEVVSTMVRVSAPFDVHLGIDVALIERTEDSAGLVDLS